MTQPLPFNPALKRLGFSPDDRVVILHADDIGMCHASVAAFDGLWAAGVATSGAVMMPCAWSGSAAGLMRAHPNIDLGVHLTMTSEWAEYRWGPMSTRDPASGLMDEQGFFYRATRDMQSHIVTEAQLAYLEREIETQIQAAKRAGIQPSHIDSHMFSVMHPAMIDLYLDAARRHQLPLLAVRGALWEGAWDATMLAGRSGRDLLRQVDESGLASADHIGWLDMSGDVSPMEPLIKQIDSLRSGLTHLLFHPSTDTPELRAIAPDWRTRVAEYELFCRPEAGAAFAERGVSLIGYRALMAG